MAQRLYLPREQVFSNLGAIGAGYKLYSYETGTTTPKVTYSNVALSTPNANPIIADPSGRLGDIFVDDLSDYKLILKDASDNTIWTADPVDPKVFTLDDFDPRPTSFWGTTSGTSTAYTLVADPVVSAYSSTQTFFFQAHTDCGNSPTITYVDGGTALNLKKYDGTGSTTALVTGDLQGGQTYEARNNGTDVVILNPQRPYFDGQNILAGTNSAKGVVLLTTKPSIANGTDTEHDIDFGAYTMQFSDGSGQAVQTAKTKRADATWASGTGNGGMASGVSLSNNTPYYMFALSKSDGTLVDFGFDSSNSATNLIAGSAVTTYFGETPKYQYLGCFRTDGSANIRNGKYKFAGNNFYTFFYKDPITDFDITNPGTGAVSRTLSVAPNSIALFHYSHWQSSPGGLSYSLITNLDQTDTAPSSSIFTSAVDGASNQTNTELQILTNNSSQIRTRNSGSDAGTFLKIFTNGWNEYL